MKVWRLVHIRHVERAWTGEGARLKGGRWNSPGRPVVYASEHAALATLEILVQVSPRDLPVFRLVSATIPDEDVREASATDIPEGWDAYPHRAASQTVGDAWLDDGSHLALKVPSSLVPGENVLVNPRHEGFGRVKMEAGPREIPLAGR